MEKLIFVGLGGFIGSSLRYTVSIIVQRLIQIEFPLATLLVNFIGAILIGFMMQIDYKSHFLSPNFHFFMVTGILGGFTTVSAFSYETIQLFQNGRFVAFWVNILLNVSLSLLGVFLGILFFRLCKH